MKYKNLALEIVSILGPNRRHDKSYIKLLCEEYADGSHLEHESINSAELFEAVKKEIDL